MHLLRQIVDQVVAVTSDDPDGGLERNEIYRLLDVRGKRNEHLGNPLNLDPNVHYFRPRAELLSGDELVHGQFLLFSYCQHDPYAFSEDCDNLTALAESILSDGGILNPFLTFLIPFIDFRAAAYRIHYRGSDGLMVPFNKGDQYSGLLSINEKYPDRQISWIGKLGT